MDALTSFINLTDSIPEWLIKLDQLAAQVAEQHARFATLTHLTQLKLRRKHDSTESLRPGPDDRTPPRTNHDPNGSASGNNKKDPIDTAMAVDTPMPLGQLDISNSYIDSTVILREVRRKRKPRSSFSGASGPRQYRTRSMIIVYYDSAIQEAFESLVRSIASARNNLRKGKTAISFKARMAALGMDETLFGGPGDLGLNPKVIRSRLQRTSPHTSHTEYVPAFDEVDQHLEAAQSLCEVAAHQFLRDGDCSDEIEGTRTRFQNCLGVAQREADALRQQKSQESPESVAEDQAEDQPDEPKVIALDEKVDLSAASPVTYANVGTIEVDNESDASSVQIDLKAFRRARRG
ncbi:hypothetical protein MMC07_004978 [Pseudocyphellaria aurata]|nr:hypothetical protein [Pseudocyphellaria aurata]